MHSRAAVAEVLKLREAGLGARRISARTDLPVATVRDWLAGRLPRHSADRDPTAAPSCERCGHDTHLFERLPWEYVYLLGLYLGDGCISRHPRNVYRLRVFLDLRYPGIVDECQRAMETIAPLSRVHRLYRRSNYVRRETPSNVEVSAFSKLWPCLFPQHGDGRKHQRRIALEPWQEKLVDQWPEFLLRGLIHSDGCRYINTGRNGWRWPRYSFSNNSADILGIFCDACDRMGLRWTKSGQQTIYVSRKADVAALDEFIGPKR